MHKLQENLLIEAGIAPVMNTDDTAESNATGVDMTNYGLFCAVVQVGTGMEGAVTVEITESTDNTTYAAISGGAVTATISSNTEGGITKVECRVEQMTSGYKYLRAEVAQSGTQELVNVVNIRALPRFPQETLS